MFPMGSVASTGFSIGNLLQSLTNSSPQLSFALSSNSVQAALQNASPSDLADLSGEALQLQESDLLFDTSTTGTSQTIPYTPDPLFSLLSSLDSSTASGSSASSSTASLSNQLSGYQSDLASQEMQSLFGVGPTGPAPSTLFDMLG